MKRKIFKYELDVASIQLIGMPEGAEILSLQVQYGNPVIWAVVDPSAPKVARELYTVVTGGTVGDNVKQFDYIGTYMIEEDTFVGHVYINKEES